MHTDITYEKALEKHPQVVKSMMQSAKLKNPKWKHKILPGDKATHWYYDSSITVSFNPDQNGIIVTHLVVQNHNNKISTRLTENPEEILEYYRKLEEKRNKEQEEWNALSPKQRKARVHGILAALNVLGS